MSIRFVLKEKPAVVWLGRVGAGGRLAKVVGVALVLKQQLVESRLEVQQSASPS